jgi:hypothetical protein
MYDSRPLWRDQDKRAKALDLVAPVYSWFTQGLRGARLIDSKALFLGLNEGTRHETGKAAERVSG